MNDKYIDINSEEYNNLNIEKKIDVIKNNLKILTKDFDDNCLLLIDSKKNISKKEELSPNTKLLIYKEFENKCREANNIINNSLNYHNLSEGYGFSFK